MATDNDFFQVLGRISVVFSALDLIVTLIIRGLVVNNLVKDKDTLGKKLMYLAKLQAHDVTDANVLNGIQSLLPKAQPIVESRNRFIHDQWVLDAQMVAAAAVRRIKLIDVADSACGIEWTKVTLSELNGFCDELVKLQYKFCPLYDQVREKAGLPLLTLK
ncbi:MAG TPA: hypothetical protein VHY91_17970 [Pirellulales bacterium]|nr:hypothetical protein [Pirellulales bacterium]